jgi:xylan 1,4-beta-xylosidase
LITNPILPGFNPDPSTVRVGDDFYIAVSTFEWYPGVQIHHSRDLRHWRLAARPLNRAALLDMTGNPDSGGIWAPCLSWDDGLFYLIYTDVKRLGGDFKDTHNYLTTCEAVDGRWSDPVYLNSSGFDPSLFHDDDGRKWLINMVWDYRYERNRFGGIYLQEYCSRSNQLIGDIVNIFRGTELGLTEAPHLYKRNGYYYLVTAEGGTGYGHAMTLARSRNLTGPYEVDPQGYLLTAKDHPELALQRAGHGSLFDTPQGETYLVHLCSRPLENLRRSPLGRETALQKTRWSDDGWLRLEGTTGDGLPELRVVAPDLREHPWPKESTCHEFDDGILPTEFQWLRTPEPERFLSLEERPGFLRLKGKASIGSWFYQALVARRQEAFCFSAETRLEFNPSNIQQSAGLVCYYNAHKFHYLYLSVDERGRRFVDIMSCLGDDSGVVAFLLSEARGDSPAANIGIELPAQGAVWLRCDVAFAELTFSWSLDGEQWQEIPVTLDYSLISDEAGRGAGGSFTGAFVGMCCQDLSGQDRAADFDCFYYRETAEQEILG